jgi:hypothetical protein
MAVEVCPETAIYRRAEDMWPENLVAPASLEEEVSQLGFLREIGHSFKISHLPSRLYAMMAPALL